MIWLAYTLANQMCNFTEKSHFSPKKSFSVGRSKVDLKVGRQKSTSTDLKRPIPNTKLKLIP